jgi:quercetin dioxygenase-like cupin family protein
LRWAVEVSRPTGGTMSYTILNGEDLQRDGACREFQGDPYNGTDVSFIWMDLPPGSRARRHRQPYAEVPIVQEGRGTYALGAATLEAQAGQIRIVPPQAPHK